MLERATLKDRTCRLDWILTIPDSSISNPLKLVEESFERLVSARKATVHTLAQFGQGLIQLDEDSRKKKSWITGDSIITGI